MPSTTRDASLAALTERELDVLVIGGGITGAGIARDAALRGLTVGLVEKDDFGSGTSSRSSRLVHGGIRYLEHGYLHLVFESSAERRRLLKLAPHLVRPLAFLWPVYRGARVPRWKLAAGLTLYDALALFRNAHPHRMMSVDGVRAVEPGLRTEALLGGARYFDAATDDTRLTLANALDARSLGAMVVNHAAVRSLIVEKGTVRGAVVEDTETGRSLEARARVVVNAAGPWSDAIHALEHSTDAPAVHGSKGVHVLVPRDRIGNHDAITLLSVHDGRVMFVLPSGPHAIIGTTDTYTDESPDQVRASESDVAYLVESANHVFPEAHLTRDDVISAWAGIRPLVNAGPGASVDATREHAITVSPAGVVSITGGKLTTYRVMAEETVDVVLRRLGKPRTKSGTRTRPLPGGAADGAAIDVSLEEQAAAEATGAIDVGERLVAAYGANWRDAWRVIAGHPGGTRRLDPSLPYLMGEMAYAVDHEMARTLGDLLIRRTHAAFQMRDHALGIAPIVAATLGWKSDRIQTEIEAYRREVDRLFAVSS